MFEEAQTRDSELRDLLTQRALMVIDVTGDDATELRQRLGVPLHKVPVFVFLDGQGHVKPDRTLVGWSRENTVVRMKRTLETLK